MSFSQPPADAPGRGGPTAPSLIDGIRHVAFSIAEHPECIAWLSMVLALLLLLLRLSFADDDALAMWISSDVLYPVNVATDIFRDGYHLSGWRFSIAPQWFPDLVATGLFWAVTQNVILGTLLGGFIQIPLIVAGFHLVGRAVGLRSLWLQDTLLLGLGVAITLYVASNTDASYPLLYKFFLPQMHVGNMVSMLYGWALAMCMIRRRLDGVRTGMWIITTYTALCVLAGMSDLLFLPHMLGPLTAALLLLLFFRTVTWRDCWLPVLLGWIAAVSGVMLNRTLFTVTDVSAQSGTSFDRIMTSGNVFLKGFLVRMHQADMIHLLAAAWVAICLGYFAWFIRRAVLVGPSNLQKSQVLLATFFLASVFSSVSSIAAIVLGGSNSLANFRDYVWAMQYLHPAFLFPLFALTAAVAWVIETWPSHRIQYAIGSFGILLVALVPLATSSWPVRPIYEYRPPLVRFIDEIAPTMGLRYGYAGYWQARLITLLSRTGVRCYAIDEAMKPYLWANNEEWYHRSLEDRQTPPPMDFVVLDDPIKKLSRDAAVQAFGDPALELQAQDAHVLIYREESSPGMAPGHDATTH